MRRTGMLSALLLLPVQLWAAETSCPLTVQIRDFQPKSCYHNFNTQQCVDRCEGADPGFTASCFKAVTLPCAVTDRLLSTAPGRQQRPPYRWIHVADLLADARLVSELQLVQQQLYTSLYNEFVLPPPEQGFSPASDELRKENFRLALMGSVTAATEPLKQAGLYRRLVLGRQLEAELTGKIAYLKQQTDEYPYFSSSERQRVKADIDLLAANQLKFWQITAAATADSVVSSRIKQLNQRLARFATSVAGLNSRLQAVMLQKSALLDQYAPVALRLCQSGVCHNPIVKASDILAQDQQLNEFERYLTMLSNEALALQQSLDHQFQPQDPFALRRPDFAGFINQHWRGFQTAPADATLAQLATAIHVAFNIRNQRGDEIYQNLSSGLGPALQGFNTLAAIGSKPVLLCSEQQRLAPELQQISLDVHGFATEALALIRDMLSNGRTEEKTDRLAYLMVRLQQLTQRSNLLASVDQFSDDRLVQVSWQLGPVASRSNSQIALEYLEYDGMFWTPAMSATPQQVIPAIADISNLYGSLLPAAAGPASFQGDLALVVRHSPYFGCQASNKTLRMVIRLTDKAGNVSRQALQTTFDQL